MITESPAPPRAYRSSEGRFLGGVASGIARHLDLDVLWVRVTFVVAAALGGFGLFAYAALWLTLPAERHLDHDTPGGEAATRRGMRPGRSGRLEDVGPLVAFAALAVGVAVLAQHVFGTSLLFWPVLLGVVGLAVLWRQADEAQRERWVDSSGRIDVLRTVVGGGGVAAWTRLLVGVGLLLSALVLFAVQTGPSGLARDVVIAGGLGVLGLGLTIGPWLFRLVSDLTEERTARIRTQERADVAAHLHDSVLQTLALIQKHAQEPKLVATLARAQERDLRGWLYGEEVPSDLTVAGALRAAAAEVEDAHGVPVEVVTVGDAPATEPLRALLLAAREAMVNAARHSEAARVDVYAESGDREVEVFVRDRGQGFERASVPHDRLGVRHSIEDRVRRHGGSAEVRTTPGEGTEVRLRMAPGPDVVRHEEGG